MSAGAVIVGTAGLRREPDHASEMVTQAVLGETFDVIERSSDGKWLSVRLERDGDHGWLRDWYAAELTPAHRARWREAATAWVAAEGVEIRETAGTRAPILAVAPWQARVRPVVTTGSWTEVELPDGRRGFVPARRLEQASIPGGAASPGRVVKTAVRQLGAPYLWGGRTPAGYDCSGLIQSVLAWHGVMLPRDSQEQRAWMRERGRQRRIAREGEERWKALRPGDLLFFGPDAERVTHVALATGGSEVIHAYGWVRPGSLKESSEVYVHELVASFLEAYSIPRNGLAWDLAGGQIP